MVITSLPDQEKITKTSFSVFGYIFIMLLMYVIWYFYVMSLKDIPMDIKNVQGGGKIISIISLSFLYVALSPFAGFPYEGDTLWMILSTITVCVLSGVLPFIFLVSKKV